MRNIKEKLEKLKQSFPDTKADTLLIQLGKSKGADIQIVDLNSLIEIARTFYPKVSDEEAVTRFMTGRSYKNPNEK